MATSFAPLVLRSNYSLLHGTTPVERVVEEAARRGYSAVALTDIENLYGAIPFYLRAREAGIKPIIGTEVRDGHRRVVLLAKNYEGYSNICRILSRKHLSDTFSLPAALEEFHEGLFFLTKDTALANDLAERVPRGNLFILWPGSCNGLAACGEAVPVVASPDVHFLDAEERPIHRLLRAIGLNSMISRVREEDLAPPSGFLPAAEAFREACMEYPEALRNNARIVEECNLEIPMGKPIFPKFPLPDGVRAAEFLRKLCMDGLPRRYPVSRDAALRRLEHELEIIEKLGFTEYFIFVWDILSGAREKGIATIGRGSGASSIVSYLLGVTSIDPLAYHIPFERFLHLKRADCPDLDIDLCWIRRDEVIESIYRKYGESRVAMVATHGTFRLRGAVREVGKALGMSNDLVNRISRRLPYDSDEPVAETLARAMPRNMRESVEPATLRELCRMAESIRGFPHNIGIHCGGLVIADKPLDSYVPLERAAKGIVITQFEKDAIEEIGLVKMDFLGNHGLTIRDEALRLAAERGAQAPSPEEIPDDDPATAEMISGGRTLSCCQMESPAMRHLLQMTRARTVRQVMQVLALVRPGPAGLGMKERFVRRARGLEPPVLPHPALAEALGDSYGIMLYEDDAMLVACALAHVTPEEGDLLRKAISKSRSREALRQASRTFLEKAAANGVPREVSEEMWTQMAKFNAYSFCKAHAASYALMAWQIAWLKAHHPLEFMTAVLNHQWGMYPKRVHVEEAKRLGLRLLPPCVNHSAREFTVEDGAIRVGLEQVKGLNVATIDAAVAARKKRLFAGIGDFVARVPIAKTDLRSLILCGAFDFTGIIRPELIWQSGRQTKGSGALKPLGLLTPLREPPIIGLDDFDPETKLRHELETLEMTIGPHPIALLRAILTKRGFADSRAVPQSVGKQIRLAGILAAERTTPTARGEMEFLTLEDEYGIFEVSLFPDVYRASHRIIQDAGPYIVEGVVEEQYDVLTVTTQRITTVNQLTATNNNGMPHAKTQSSQRTATASQEAH